MDTLTAPAQALGRRLALTTAFVVWTGIAAAAAPAWSDVNVNGAQGGSASDATGISVTGTGTDIWGTADSFHFTYQEITGDTDFRARITSVSGAEAWTKAGLMIRQQPDDPASAHHFLLASKGKGLAYQRRLTTGAASASTSLAFTTAPVWFRIVRSGGRIDLATSSDGVNWQAVATVAWPIGPTYIGFAVSSHDTTTVATGAFDHVALTGSGRTPPAVTVVQPVAAETVLAGQPYPIRWQATDLENDIASFDVYSGSDASGAAPFYEPVAGCTGLAASARQCTWQNPNPPDPRARVLVVATDSLNDVGRAESGAFIIGGSPGGIPAGWSSDDVGSVSAAGSASASGGTLSVTGSGSDIWGNADEFQFLHQTVIGDFILTARVASVEAIDQWTKAGLMVRESLAAGARHVSLFATPSSAKGVAFQRRLADSGPSTSTAGPAIAPPVWLKLARTGWAVNAYYRQRITDPWQFLAREVVTNFAPTLEVGLAVSSHVDGQLATAQFTDVTIDPMRQWNVAAIGTGQGSASYDGVVFGLFGQGTDIWSVADAFVYGYIQWTGDGTMTARVRDVEPSDPWAKAGVMFRESLAPGAKHVFALLSSGKGAALQYRATTDGASASAASAGGAAPGWVRLTRAGNTFTYQLSADGTTWRTVGSVTVSMGASIYVGIAHTSHDPDAPGGARFDDLDARR